MSEISIELPDDLLERIDREVRRYGGSRSTFLQEAARRQLVPDPETIEVAVKRAQDALAGAGAFESAELIRASRDDRRDADGPR